MTTTTTTSAGSFFDNMIEELRKVATLERKFHHERLSAENTIDEAECRIEDLQVAVEGLREMLDERDGELEEILGGLTELSEQATRLTTGDGYGEDPVADAQSALDDLVYSR